MGALESIVNGAKGLLGIKELSLDQQIQAIRDDWYQQHSPGDNLVDTDAGWVKEVYADYIIVESPTGLFKVPYGKDAEGNVAFGERTEVKIEYVPAKAGALAIYKDKAGDWRWIGWLSNIYRDNDRPREILSAKAHKRFVAKADELGKYPELWFWHVPGSKVAKADWLGFADGFLMASGSFDKDQAGVAETLAKSTDALTMSHGFVRLKHDPEHVVTDDYWMFECSITPKGVEANPWTEFRAIGKETDMPLSEAKKSFLAKYLPAEVITEIENNTKSLKEAAEAAGVDFKEVEGADAEPTPTEPAPAMDVKALADALIPLLTESFGMKGLSDTVAALQASASEVAAMKANLVALEARLSEVQKSEDEKVAKALTPKAAEMFSWMNTAHVASKSPGNVLGDSDDDKKLKEAAPKASAFDAFVSGVWNQ